MINATSTTYDSTVSEPSAASATSWGAIFAGAAAATALSWILLLLGSGLGFAAMSPWSSEGLQASTIGITAVIWVLLTHIIASGMGGYLAGRLRVKWVETHDDEVFFRDTAHGFMTWAVAVIITAVMMGSAIASTAAAAGKAGSAAMSNMASAAGPAIAGEVSGSDFNPLDYFSDRLFRSGQPGNNVEDARAEAVTILTNAMRTGEMSADDRQHLGRVVAQRTGISQAEAEQRVTTIFSEVKQTTDEAQAKAKEAADAAAGAAAKAALWGFVALLCGAFAASFAATFGGRQRDSSAVVRRRAA